MRVIINIDVPDLASGIDFYTKAVGLHLTRIIENDVAELEGYSSAIYLLEKKCATASSHRAISTRDYARHWTPVHLDFVVDNIETAKKNALLAGAICESECVEWLGSKCITFSDPFGHGFCLIEFKENSYQSHA